jgi:hypothetical protein
MCATLSGILFGEDDALYIFSHFEWCKLDVSDNKRRFIINAVIEFIDWRPKKKKTNFQQNRKRGLLIRLTWGACLVYAVVLLDGCNI